MALRKTIERDTVVAVANRMISHLAESGTKSDSDKREAIIAVTDSILSEAGSYCGKQYLVHPPLGAESLTYENGHYFLPNGYPWVWDNTRVVFY